MCSTVARRSGLRPLDLNNPNKICREVLSELRGRPDATRVNHLKTIFDAAESIKVLTCNHCVECCNPPLCTEADGRELASLEHLRGVVHHAAPNVRSQRVGMPPLTAPDAASVDAAPSALWRRRAGARGGLRRLALPDSYTNIPRIFQEILLVSDSARRTTTPLARLLPRSVGEENVPPRQRKSGKRKRSLAEIETKDVSFSRSQSLCSDFSTEFRFEGVADGSPDSVGTLSNQNPGERECQPAKLRLKGILASYRMLSHMMELGKALGTVAARH
ncbi:hypothetical protein HOP50_02g18960 [Chloropicon primus]|uniref:Uncharacterized protein n=1 Tax=Chloropicon primus TaxID=1764295 RepID=A0A5B8MG42_9CHLO|nr:hypothetical protein A3770_02p18970 [Chloropicon primus]QDZ19381.1 hypothetical protein A3770_02p18990 [Chloropicon primus]UPQ98588.1 hypothetical protein HOP50_02g18940 [Chloropicon primus]UPQ98590.1 hypothetical protein HOP50_02g18960 [Chloropicon primus]|eukprot:QDZ19379.1 hypothetical protein A3770_02p18970 [Chloropicon primus]